MSTPAFSSPPPADGGGASVAGIIVGLVVLVVIGIISLTCAKMTTRAIVSDLQARVAPPPPPTLNVVRVWEIDVPTMERFLQELAKDRPVRFTAQQLCSFTTNYSTRLGSGGLAEARPPMSAVVKMLEGGGGEATSQTIPLFVFCGGECAQYTQQFRLYKQ
ncbi:hypothetical protein LOK49_LG13G02529 [Camellia lanceoleosa]|uniref:Uncharacterized protein n=1 Tax=Camellia lanceoleosa TaxID=1840588 RepID=A0ACC0FLG6_9ERIC|nr:hypothetical protein LOK49_LG13G02529 [Camellia lanceoleosa]